MGIFVRNDVMMRYAKWLMIGIFLLSIEVSLSAKAQIPASPCSQFTIIGTLNWREPTIEAIQNYLCFFALGGEGQPDAPDLSENTELIYRDIDGDKEPDLIVSDYLYVGVFRWLTDRDEYFLDLQIHPPLAPRNPYSKTFFEDWTNDGTSEVIFDVRSAYSGTDIAGDTWTRDVIHCEAAGCNLAWSGELADYFYIASSQDGMSLRQSDLEFIVEPDNKVILLKTTREFAANCPYCSLNNDPIQSYKDRTFLLRVGDTIQTHFRWNGKTFEQVEETVLQPRYIIEPQSNLDALNLSGRQAIISVEKVGTRNSYEGQRDSCQLTINGDDIGESFLCLPDYTHVDWIDMTQDGENDLLVTVLASGLDSEKFTSFHPCVYQRLLAYQFSQNGYEQIADVSGCMVSEDFFGVRIADMDADGQPEIVSAGELTTHLPDDCFGGLCWYELNKLNDVYKWDGQQFTYWQTIPR
jgi:hypothetical protein